MEYSRIFYTASDCTLITGKIIKIKEKMHFEVKEDSEPDNREHPGILCLLHVHPCGFYKWMSVNMCRGVIFLFV